jgi:hypothetical protein
VNEYARRGPASTSARVSSPAGIANSGHARDSDRSATILARDQLRTHARTIDSARLPSPVAKNIDNPSPYLHGLGASREVDDAQQ